MPAMTNLGYSGLRVGMTEAEFLDASGGRVLDRRQLRHPDGDRVVELLSIERGRSHCDLVGVFAEGRLQHVNDSDWVADYLQLRGYPKP